MHVRSHRGERAEQNWMTVQWLGDSASRRPLLPPTTFVPLPRGIFFKSSSYIREAWRHRDRKSQLLEWERRRGLNDEPKAADIFRGNTVHATRMERRNELDGTFIIPLMIS